ncbi:MAG TPA: hypothetical protein VFK52_09090 [Nocardioidaceae bacterium]|nr:hypothetical protein [Nocardioidaceae bacterium]
MADERDVAPPLAQPVTEANWPLRIVLGVGVLAVLGIAYLFGTTVVPRWWAHRVGRVVDGSLTAGTLYGLFIGLVFTLVPLLVARQALRRMRMKLRLAVLALALVAAAPNLMTLAIVLGSGSAAHAGERTLDVDGPGFRAGSAWGAVIALVLALGLFVWTWKWRRDRRQLRSLKSEKRAQKVEQERAQPSD